ncbi:MAG: tetratricopeptide repeat protein [Polyangiaceae bacterium]|nr:tetratricopeptide repeat protein [Polyangiaceae bacterium]
MRHVVVCAAAISMLVATSARADDAALAEALFQEGIRLLEQGSTDEACTKLARAVELAGPTAIGGTLKLADCREKQGRPATAWALYRKAYAFAQRSGDARAADAEASAARLDPTLPRLVVRVSPELASNQGLTLRRGDEPIPREAWGLAAPVDPGVVVVVAEVTAGSPHETRVTIPPGPKTHEVVIAPWSCATTPGCVESPKEKPEPAPVKTSPTGDEPSRFGSLGIAGVVGGGAGVAVLGAALGVMVDAKSKYDDALAAPEHECGGGRCNLAGKVAIDDARVQGDIATGLTIGGAVLAAAGATMLVVDLVTPGSESERVSLEVGPAGVFVTGELW